MEAGLQEVEVYITGVEQCQTCKFFGNECGCDVPVWLEVEAMECPYCQGLVMEENYPSHKENHEEVFWETQGD